MSQFIIYAYLFDGEGGASVLDEKALSAWTPEQGVLWVHLDYAPGVTHRSITFSQGSPRYRAMLKRLMEAFPPAWNGDV